MAAVNEMSKAVFSSSKDAGFDTFLGMVNITTAAAKASENIEKIEQKCVVDKVVESMSTNLSISGPRPGI